MPAALGPGDFVEFLGAQADGLPKAEWYSVKGGELVVGRVYQVRDLRTLRCPVSGEIWEGLRLVGLVFACPDGDDAYAQVYCFRPVYRPRAELIESLKAPPISAPVRQTEDA